MGCLLSKNKVAPAPEDDSRHFNLGKRKQKTSARIRSPIIPWAKRTHVKRIEVAPAPNSTPSPTPSFEDGRKSVAFTVPLEDTRIDSPVQALPPNKLQPLSHPQMSAEILMRKQQLADAKREEALHKKRQFAHKVVKRREDVLKTKETERAHSTQQILAQQKTAEMLRQSRQKEIVERQKQREERAEKVRQQKTEPLNDNRLTAFISFDDKKTPTGQKTVNTTEQKRLHLLEKMSKRTEEVAREAEKKKLLTNQRIEAQLNTALQYRMARLKQAAEVQQQTDQRAEEQVLKNTEAKMDLTVPQSDDTTAVVTTPNAEEKHIDERPLCPAPFPHPVTSQERSSEEDLHTQLADGQMLAIINRQAKQREVIMRQKWRALKAKDVRRKAQALKEEKEEEFDIGEIEADPTYGGQDDVDIWGFPYTDRPEEVHQPEPDDFFDG